MVCPCRNLVGEDEDVETGLKTLQEVGFINYYGLQRFGTQSVCTHHVGRLVLAVPAVAACFGCMGCLNGLRAGQWVVCMLFSYYMVWSGLVQLSFVWCGQDWYSCALCGVCMLFSYHTFWSGLV